MPFADTYPQVLNPAPGDRVIVIHTNDDGSVVTQRTTVSALTASGSIQNNITAAVGGQGSAVQLTGGLCIVRSVPQNSGVILTAAPGQTQKVFNRDVFAQTLLVFPIVGMAIENKSTNVAVSIAVGDAVSFTNDGTVFVIS